jgi:putative serine protease PepD
MTMTYDPFTPAGRPEQRGYGGRRRAEEQVEDQRRAGSGPGWAESRDERAGSRPEWSASRREWAESPEWQESRGWDDQAATRSWGEAPTADRGWDDPRAAPQGRTDPRAAQPGRTDPRTQQGWTEPHVQPQGWVEDRHWTPPQQRTGEQPGWPADPARSVPAVAEPEPVTRTRRGRAKPLAIGVVVLLILLAGWQAYRIEGMSQHNADLASAMTAEKDRTDRLEKQLAGMFDPEGVSSSVLPSVFRVRAGDLTGTAFSVGRKAKTGESNLFTNYHVVAAVWTAGGKRVSLERGNTKITATIEKVDKAKDLALLHADQAIAGLAMAAGEVKPGQQVVVVGAPLGLDDTVTTGVISAYRPDDRDGPTIQFDAPINPGNSGGPVVNSSKRVVGVATAKAKDAEGIGLAIPIKTACDTFDVC